VSLLTPAAPSASQTCRLTLHGGDFRKHSATRASSYSFAASTGASGRLEVNSRNGAHGRGVFP
jgi:hypothetical protein